MTLILVVFSFFMGSLPFAVWLVKIILHGTDVRSYGDGNPGATNALRAGGWRLWMLVLFLDVFKGALPVGLAYFIMGLRGIDAWLVAVSAILGHAYSPFLQGRGGKALAVMLGVWIGLTKTEMPFVLLVCLIILYGLIPMEGWAVLATAFFGLLYLLIFNPNILFIAVMIFQIVLIVIKHWQDYRHPPMLREQLTRIFRSAR